MEYNTGDTNNKTKGGKLDLLQTWIVLNFWVYFSCKYTIRTFAYDDRSKLSLIVFFYSEGSRSGGLKSLSQSV
jgi:hypothetical protein